MDCVHVPEEQLMHRFYADPDRSPEKNAAYLTPEDAHHALNVLRLKVGSPVELIDGSMRFRAVIESVDGNGVQVRKEDSLPSTETAVSFTLFQSLPKGDKMEMIIQKAVELGVSRIVPVVMNRCVVRLNGKDAARKQERWQKIAREAGKQCGRCIIPEVTLPVPVEGIASFRKNLEEIVVPWELSEKYGPMAFVRDHPGIRSLGIVIGPEGGIEDGEISFLTALPAKPITLGRRILRTETAGMAAVSAFSALYGEME